MKKRILSLGIVFALMLSLLPGGAFAAKATTVKDKLTTGVHVVSQTDYTIIDGVTETDIYLNDSSGNMQNAGFLTTVSKGAAATFKASYSGYYTAGSNPSTRKNATFDWSLKKTTEQAAAYEAATGETVIMATNADYFNMQTGQPLGYLIMEGNTIQTNSTDHAEPYFAVLKDGSYAIRDYGTDTSDVLEAISGPFYLVKDGKNVTDANDTSRIPRNSVGLKEDGSVVTFMSDGRQSPYSVGMTLYELADFLIAQGVVTALYLDGGGSAMVATRREGEDSLTIRNSPSDGVERADSSVLLLVADTAALNSSSEFDHATVSPNNEYYTPGSTVNFTAKGISSSGNSAELPESGLTWALDSDSKDMGTIDAGTGVFTSNGKTGTVTAVLKYNGKEVGSSSITIIEPDEIYFGSDSLSLDFGEESDLGLVARADMVEVNFKAGDFTWTLSGDIGSMSENTFVAGTYEDTINGTVTVSYTRSDGTVLSDEISLEIGKMPIVAFDFELDKNGNRQLAAHFHWGKATFVDNGTTVGYYGDVNKVTVITSNTYNDNYTTNTLTAPFRFTGNWDGAVPASDIFRANGYTYYLWPNNSITTYNVGSLSTVTEEEGGQVRFGDYSLQLNFDYRSFDNSSNSNWYIRYAGDPTVETPNRENYDTEEEYNAAVVQAARDSAYYIEGTPKSVGVWVYADESVQGFHLYTDIMYYDKGDYNSYHAQLVHEAADGSGTMTNTIDWTGWKYVSGDISAIAQYVTDEHPLAIIPGSGLLWLSYQPASNATTGANRTAGTIYFDNYRFVYGADTDDLDNPEITGITVNGTEIAKDSSTTISTGAVELTATFDDPEGANVSGIDATKTTFKIDGETVSNDGGKSTATTRLELTNGQHSIQVTVYDGFGNYSTETRYFTVKTEGETNTATLTGADVVTMGTDYVLTLKTEGDVTAVEMTVQQVNASFGKPTVTAMDGWTVESSYESIGYTRAKMTISATWTGKGTPSADIATFSFAVPSDLDAEIDFFTYQVTGATCTLSDGSTVSAAQPKVSISLSAYYTVEAGISVSGYPTTLTVTDINGDVCQNVDIYVNNTLAGSTDENGQFNAEISKTLKGAETFTVSAKDSDGKVSFTTTITVMGVSSSEVPTGIATVATDNNTTSQTITWLSSYSTSACRAMVQYSTNADMTDAVTLEGTATAHAFETSKDSALINTVTITGLTPGTKYYYQVGNGIAEEGSETPTVSTWSKVYSFKTSAEDAETTKFFVVGDTQMSGNTESDASYIDLLNQIAGRVEGYDFGIQTGDYVDNGGNYAMWEEIQTVFGNSFSGIDIIHTNGNHEYFGDSTGVASALIYNRSGDYYSVEYGNVYVAVINLNANLEEALAWLVEDAQSSNADWKVLSIHQPAYYTNVNGGSERYNRLVPSAAEQAGINVVFSGHDHSYSRTQPMVGGQVDENNGVVYFTCGDLGEKSRNINYAAVNTEEFNFAFITQDYSALYLDIEATSDTLSIIAMDADGKQIDNTELHKLCYNGHTYEYDKSSGKLYCTVCETESTPADAQCNGWINVKDSDEQVYFIAGVLQTGWTQIGKEMHHFADDGTVHEVTKNDPTTCTKGGRMTYTCTVCGATTRATSYTYPKGHTWATNEDGDYLLTDDGHRYCTVCGKVGISLDEVSFDFGTVDNPRNGTTTPKFVYSASGVRPAFFGTYDGTTALSRSSDNTLNSNGTMRDLFVSWPNSTSVGEAKIKIVGRGDYYGEAELTYIIVPDSVSNFYASYIEDTTATLAWSAASGVGYYQVYRCDASNTKDSRVLVATTTDTSCTVELPTADGVYHYVVAGRTKVDGTTYTSPYWSDILRVGQVPNITSITALVDGQSISAQDAGGETYLFLPSSADLSAVALDIQIDRAASITLSGNKSEAALDGTVDVTALADAVDSVYAITVKLNDDATDTLHIMQASEIPAVYLKSDDPVNTGRSFVEASKSNSTTASMVMLGTDGSAIYDGALTQLKCRGNSTFSYCDKKSYQVKLGNKSDLLSDGESVKTYVLLAAYDDATKVHDKTIKDLASSLGMSYVASSTWVDLYYDGEYCGIYLLGEKNSVSSTGVDITDLEDAYEEANENYGSDASTATGTNDYGQTYQYTEGLTEPDDITGGYLIELNLSTIDEASGFYTSQGQAFNVKSPEYAGNDAMKYISEYYQEFENAVYATDENGNYTGYNAETGKYYYEYCDKESLVQAFLLQELCVNPDGFRSSMFFYKDANDIMYCGPVWDQELIFGTGWKKHFSASTESYHYLAEALIQIPDFEEAVRKYYALTFAPAIEQLVASGGILEQSTSKINNSVLMDNKLWPFVYIGYPSNTNHLWAEGTTYQDVVTDMISWVNERITVLESRFGGYEPPIEPIVDVVTAEADVNVPDTVKDSLSEEAAEVVESAADAVAETTIEGNGLNQAVNEMLGDNYDENAEKEEARDLFADSGIDIPEDTEITIVVQQYMSIEIKGASVNAESGSKSLTLNIKPMAQVIATTDASNIITDSNSASGTQNSVAMGEAQELKVTKAVTVSVPLPEGFAAENASLYVKHTTKSEKTYIYRGTVSENVLSFNNPHGFSEFEIGSEDPVAMIGEVGYTSLQDAIDEAANGGTVVVLQNASATLTTTKRVNISNGSGSNIVVTVNGTEKALEPQASDTVSYVVPTVSIPYYAISLTQPTNGSVTASCTTAAAGTSVTLTVKADEGSVVEGVTVTANNGSNVDVTDNGNGSFKFTMPASKVEVTVSIKVENTDPDDIPVTKEYTDVNADNWYYKAVEYVTEKGLMNGVGDDTFEPNSNLTRAMLVTILYRLEDEPEVTENAFDDVNEGLYYTDAVNWAAENGIVQGYGDGKFGATDEITREQMAVILYNYAAYKQYELVSEDDLSDLSDFPDASDVSTWAQDAMRWAVGAELINGMDGALNPSGTASRAQVAKILMAFCEAIEKIAE